MNTELKIARQDHDEYRREYYNSKSRESINNNRTGRARLENEKWTDLTLEWIGNYFATFGKHDLKLLAGYSYQEFNNHGFWTENMDFPSDAYKYNNLGEGKWNNDEGRLGMDSWKSKEKTIAFFTRGNYNYNDTWLLSGTIRYEGNTKFGKDNKWGLFPAISGAWRISKLPALQDAGFINDLKIRLSYGETGRSGFGRYSALARYQGWGRWQNDQGEWITVYGPSNNPNPNLRWEKQLSYNAGIDFSLFNSRLTGSIDLFLRKGKDVISNYDVPVPPYLHDQYIHQRCYHKRRGV
ncbi:MAG: TonB-dependent receptor, partial [Bacteroidales bacterium]|nr:TonB-dependent receptor [Bacteroidales bacterium]